jgi:hypothetical protein
LTRLERGQLPALGGLALVSAASDNAVELECVATHIKNISANCAFPYEVARAGFELAQAWKETGDFEKSDECLACARDLAVAHGFHEVTFRSDLLAEALAAARAQVNPPVYDERVERSIARFDELPVDENALALA